MFIDGDLRVRFSRRLREEATEAEGSADWLLAFEGRELIVPPKFSPDSALIAQHRERWCVAA